MTNRFKDRMMRQMYDDCVRAYRTRSTATGAFFTTEGCRKYGSGIANEFWRGFDNVGAHQWDRASKQMVGYACWRAGRDMAMAEG